MTFLVLLIFLIPHQLTGWYKIWEGDNRVVVVAGHAADHLRDGRLKQAEAGTGVLARELHLLTGCTAIVTTGLSPLDSNFDERSPIKQAALERSPLLVIDLHGSHPSRPFTIDLGTMEGLSISTRPGTQERLEAHFLAAGLDNLSRNYFAARKQNTMTRWLTERGIPAIQLEINSQLFPTAHNRYSRSGHSALVEALSLFIKLERELSSTPGTLAYKIPRGEYPQRYKSYDTAFKAVRTAS